METRAAPLANTSWRLLGFETADGTTPPRAETAVTLSFASDEGGGRASGSGGCNRYTGSYEVTGDRLRVGPIAATRMMCPDAGRMEQEARYFQALEAAERYEVRDGELLIAYTGGVLRFAPA